ARGSLQSTRLVCGPQSGGGGHPARGPRATGLTVFDRSDDAEQSVSFGALHVAGKRHSEFFATSETREGGVGILRSLLVHGPTPDFPYSLADRTAVVTPPPPFTGTGTLTDRGSTWSGDLAVSFRGLAPISLTGPNLTPLLGHVGVLVAHAEKPAPRAL